MCVIVSTHINTLTTTLLKGEVVHVWDLTQPHPTHAHPHPPTTYGTHMHTLSSWEVGSGLWEVKVKNITHAHPNHVGRWVVSV